MTTAPIVVSNSRTWRSRPSCEYRSWLICVSVCMYAAFLSFLISRVERHSTLPVTFRSAFYMLRRRDQFTCGFNSVLLSIRFQSGGQSAHLGA